MTSRWLSAKTGLSPATVNKGLVHLQRLAVVHELTALKRHRIFCYGEYLRLMDLGTELPD